MNTVPFSTLTPESIISAAELFTGKKFDGTLTPYNSYVNRVFGLTDEDGRDFIIKFYRPGRWNAAAILDEHQFLYDCAENEVPVVLPITGTANENQNRAGNSTTLGEVEGIYFSISPRLHARTFDIYNEGDWIRAGRAIGRLHLSAQRHEAANRLQCTPQQTTVPYIRKLIDNNLITPDGIQEFVDICDSALDYIEEAYEKCFGLPSSSGQYNTASFRRIHGDCHRGNILEQYSCDSPATADTIDSGSITFIDFDDMMTGPAIQDLWLLLPGHRRESLRELNLLIDGYEEFSNIPIRRQIELIEPLRFMRHIYFLAWIAIQHTDIGFAERNPGWGTKAFWEREIEDLKAQLDVLQIEYQQFNTLA